MSGAIQNPSLLHLRESGESTTSTSPCREIAGLCGCELEIMSVVTVVMIKRVGNGSR